MRPADAADSVGRGAARPSGRVARFQPVAGLRAAHGGLFCPARRPDGNVRCAAQPAGAPAVGVGTGALRAVFCRVCAGDVWGVRTQTATCHQ